jgi:hypothetical protein
MTHCQPATLLLSVRRQVRKASRRPTVGQNIEDARIAARLGLLRREKREFGALLEDQRGVLAHGEAGRVSVDSASRRSHLTIGSLPATVMR